MSFLSQAGRVILRWIYSRKNPTRKKTSSYQGKEIERKKENLHLFPLCKLKANWTTCKGNQKQLVIYSLNHCKVCFVRFLQSSFFNNIWEIYSSLQTEYLTLIKVLSIVRRRFCALLECGDQTVVNK